ncbi:MAG: hypothetical protein IJT27_03910 [Clostridia bacterium]|nr:hypothetical protein [Clostridia bacterium]
MADLQEFKCPNCDGKLEFDAGSQKMKCPFCDSTFDPAAFGEKKLKTEKPTEQNERLWADARAGDKNVCVQVLRRRDPQR